MDFYNSDKERYARAQEQVGKLKDFYSHLAIYLVFVLFFLFLNYYTTSFPWAIFPIAGWGIGVAGHALSTFDWNPFFGRDWEQRKIEEFMRRDQ